MAKNKTDLLTLINTNLADNTTEAITPAKVREVESQSIDSALNVLEPTTQTVAGPVNFTGSLQRNGKDVLADAREVEVHRSDSKADRQQPTALATPIQIAFGAEVVGTHFDLSDAGTLTCKVAGNYAVRFKLQFGRTGASGVSVLFARVLKNGSQTGVSQCAVISASDDIQASESRLVFDLVVGDTISMQLLRDSAGVNDGGIFSRSTTSPIAWASSPSALLVVSRIEGVTA